MADDVVSQTSDVATSHYEDDISVRGCQFDLPQIKAVYRELDAINRKEGERIIASLKRPSDQTEEAFATNNDAVKKRAFRVTVSIIGFDHQTAYGDTEAIFDSGNLPLPIRTIFFTNTTAFRPEANGNFPPNYFSVWLHFDKPPIFDPNPLVSAPTENASKVEIHADDVAFIRAVQTVVREKLKKNRKWYAFIHNKFIYDVGLWLVALPYALFMLAKVANTYVPADGPYGSYRWAFIVYGIGMSLILYRCLTGYLKWAFPVNVLTENKDTATAHRVVFWAIVLGLIGQGVRSIPGILWPW